MTTELTHPSRRNWQLHRREQKNTYSLALIHTDRPPSDISGKLSRLANGVTEFQFPMNPKTMDLEEPAAVVIKPTQGGGQFIEHQGQIYKNINITGTTGLRPNPKKGLSTSLFNLRRTGLPDVSERTGFDDLIDLRNVFRTYYMAKVDPELSNNVIMVWKNGKEGEYYVVEPISFKTGRDSSSPLTATYTIVLRTIKRLERELAFRVTDSYLSRKSPLKQRSFINRQIQALANSINEANNFSDTMLSSGARYLTDIMRPTNELFSAIAALANTTQRTIEIPRSALQTLSGNLQEAIRELSETVVLVNSYDVQKATIISAFRNIRRSVTAIQARPELFAVTVNENLNIKKAQYIDSVFGTIDSGGDLTSLANESMGSGIGQGVVGANDNIRKLAKSLLGTASRWKALVIINNLKSPYISKDGDGIDVLRPGDAILYPTAGGADRTAVSEDRDGKHSTLTPVEERLGRDLLISSPTSAGGITQFDLVAGDNGDVSLVEGVPNMSQAVRIKFETEQGELPMHPFFGIKYPLGVKAPAATGFIEFDVNARATLLSDQRVDLIKDLDIVFEGNALTIKGDVLIKGFDQALSLDFSTRR